jgi:hypothetical protein
LVANETVRSSQPRNPLLASELQAQCSRPLDENIRLRSVQSMSGYGKAEKWTAGRIQGWEIGFVFLPEESEKICLQNKLKSSLTLVSVILPPHRL